MHIMMVLLYTKHSLFFKSANFEVRSLLLLNFHKFLVSFVLSFFLKSNFWLQLLLKLKSKSVHCSLQCIGHWVYER